MSFVMWMFAMVFIFGLIFIILPISKTFKFRNRLRITSARNRRRDSIQGFIQHSIKNENTKQSNYKIMRYLKTAGYPAGMQAFHFRLIQTAAPIVMGLVMLGVYGINNIKAANIQSFPIIPFLAIIVLSYICPYFILIYYSNKRREMLAEDIVKFSHRLVVCITDKIPIYYAIRRAGRTSKVIKPYVDDLLIDWMNNPRAAILHFGEQIGISEALPLTNTLLATWNAPQEKIIDLFHQQIRNIDTMRDFQIKKKIEAGPLRVTFIVLIPFLAAATLVMLPWYNNFMDILRVSF
ncbi:hypothetical protein AB4Z50_14710 [Paenibacillus sp. 2TAB26]|uniref:hypothetical protein n=1 Tax=Paenibacillus sp. 2TAB26 TaxID=3233005 RepID=UPI003F9A1F2D